MDYKKFTELKNPCDNLYNIVMKDGRAGLRGAGKKSTEEFVELVGEDNVKIFIY